MRYTKIPLSISDQLQLLESRGLNIPDRAKALHYLSNISYYRLRAYWLPLEINNSVSHRFKSGTTFDIIIDQYVFDRKLRILIFDEIERIEVALRTQIIHHYSMHFGGQWYLDPTHFRSKWHFDGFANRIKEEYRNSSEVFVTHYKNRYTNPKFPPAWVMLELASFGMLSKLFKNLKRTQPKKEVSMHFGLPYNVLESWLQALANLRNLCAHHSRVWNRKFVVQPIYPKNTANTWLSVKVGQKHRNKLYLQLCTILYLLKGINPSSSFPSKVRILLTEYSSIPIHYMGFPPDWHVDPFWS